MLNNYFQNRYFKRFRSVIITLFMVFAVNSAISFTAGNSANTTVVNINTQANQKTTYSAPAPKDTPRPKTTYSAPAPKDTPRP